MTAGSSACRSRDPAGGSGPGHGPDGLRAGRCAARPGDPALPGQAAARGRVGAVHRGDPLLLELPPSGGPPVAAKRWSGEKPMKLSSAWALEIMSNNRGHT
jgi:hypothetical protein